MILVKNKEEINSIIFQKPFEISSPYYSILLQNVVTKQVFQLNVKETYSDSLYFHFEVDLTEYDDGEYYVLLLSNPFEIAIEVTSHNIDDIKEKQDRVLIIANSDIPIKDGILFIGNEQNDNVVKITTELLRIGEYETSTVKYNNEKKYIQYNG